jgi:outer membrane protein W
MKKLTMILVGTLLMFWPLAADARFLTGEDFRYLPGQMELTIAGSGINDENFDGATLAFEAGLGYYLTEHWQAFLRQGFAYSDVSNGGSDWGAATRLGVNYTFNLERWKPFLGASIGWVYGDSIRDQFITGPEAGLKYFVNESTFIFGMMEYAFLFRGGAEAEDNWEDGRFVYSVGIGYRF